MKMKSMQVSNNPNITDMSMTQLKKSMKAMTRP